MMEKAKLQEAKLIVNTSPHIRAKNSSQWIMLQVIIALLFPTIAGTVIFGPKVIAFVVVGAVAAALSEYVYQKLLGKQITVSDLSAVVTGMLIGLTMPYDAGLGTTALLSLLAIVVFKQLFGGIGRNILNPAVAVRIGYLLLPWFWMELFPQYDVITTASSKTAILAKSVTTGATDAVDAVSSSTPLYHIGGGATAVKGGLPGLQQIFFGYDMGGYGGAVGETCKFAILIALLYLIVRRIVNPKIPLLYYATCAVIALVASGFDFEFMLYHLFTGAIIFGGAFMITDYTTGGLTPMGQTIFAVGCGILTMAFRFGSYSPGGVGFAILIMNLLIPVIDRLTAPKIVGHEKRPKAFRS
ncbi:electron transport complex protein RnfD [Trichococcus patagoniensis]|uniref:Electron transport complex protein RnfD n=1 Tax=Trichococcus patagoniensis TaxID=382641 RepID=A0A2T5IJC8_9LACT|nr:RnfABCDGE type electron transport complex subunit D [Trichococcus patagoniensis]PTQ83936.1 electron transport complex protein RnfD [Trichococcus patagoniensis]